MTYDSDAVRDWVMGTKIVQLVPWRGFALVTYATIPTSMIGLMVSAASENLSGVACSLFTLAIGAVCAVIALNKYQPD